ncbi:MAG: hypothetical protein K5639_04300 [Eubacterium sp.]|nr:hypothetical protein [Eubacterium sp.]
MGTGFKRIKDEIYTRATGKYTSGKVEIDLLSNKAICAIFKRRAETLTKINHYPDLTDAQKSSIKEYYEGCPDFSFIYHRVYTARRGVFDPAYMPDELYYGYIEPYYVDRVAARYVDNKTYYYRMYEGIKMPELVAKRVGKLWFDGDENPVRAKEIPGIVKNAEGELVLKKAENTGSGVGIYFLDKNNPAADLREKIKLLSTDVVIQKAVVQHEAYAKLHPESVNTLRVMSHLRPDGVKILGTALRIGSGESRLDNAGAGGFFIGLDDDCRTLEFGHCGSKRDGMRISEHPTLGYKVGGIEIPYVEKAHELVKKMHKRLGRFRIVSWDIAIDNEDDAVLIEANLAFGGIDTFQVCTGPVFGEDTKKVCKEVFGL